MADAPSPPRSPGGLQAVTRKLGPLPVWAWAGVVVLAFILYRRMTGKPSQAMTTQPQEGTTDQAYVPGFDAAGASGGGGIGSTPTTSNVYNYYYGDQAAGQANGGGTAPKPLPGGSPTAPPPASSLVGPNVPPVVQPRAAHAADFVPAGVTSTPGHFTAV